VRGKEEDREGGRVEWEKEKEKERERENRYRACMDARKRRTG